MGPSSGSSDDLPRPISGPRPDDGRGRLDDLSRLGRFDERSVDASPFAQFEAWYAEAQDATDDRAAAMTIATATRAGRPSARVVLLRGFDARGLVFYTNYDSRKGEELDANPHAAALFYWPQLDRQIRVEGPVSRLDRAESEAYFAGRPRGHQVGAWASPQSTPIPERSFLQSLFADAEARFARRRVGGAAPAVLGWLPAHARGVRVLGQPRRSPARPHPLPPRRRHLGHRASGAVTPGPRRASHVSCSMSVT